MRVALTKSTLRVPPTYFAVQHAMRLAAAHEFRFFAGVAEVDDPAVAVAVEIVEAVPFPALGFRRRELLLSVALPRWSRQVSSWRPDLVHQHAATWSLPAVRAARRTGAPLLTTIHGGDVEVAVRPARGAMQRWHHRNVRAAGDASARILAVSSHLAGRAVLAGLPAERIEVHYQGVDTEVFRPGDGRPDGPPRVVFAGALVERKGVLDLLAASRAAVTSAPHELRLVGAGPLAERLAHETAADAHVTLVGRLDRDALRTELQSAAALVLPTKTLQGGQEAAGLVLVEAQACGVPVIAYRSGGTPEMLREGETGLLVPEGDRPALGAALADLLGLPAADRARMSAAARRFAVEERSLAVSARELDAHYRDLFV
ncbi:glycosyltransferase [Agromyces binzhouensis]|uniref:glycosyltransferase n=1 Tax=Agromyces binzhouensis TaxID=1817495 RepID=UPI0036333255